MFDDVDLTAFTSLAEVRKHAFGGKAAAVVLPVESSCGESGFLTCAKLIRELPNARVILVGEYTEENERLALFAGAFAFLPGHATADRLAVAIAGSVA